MNKSTILALLMLISSALLFSGCVIPADSYYSDPYYQPNVAVVPALPYTVTLYEQPFYNYHGYYYLYNSQRWYYRRTKGGDWIALPRTHWPSDTRWKGHHFHNDHRDHTYGGHDERPSKDPKYQPPKAPRGNDKYRQKNNPLRKDPRYNDKSQQKKAPMQKDKRRDEMDQRRQSPGKRTRDPRQHDRNKMKQEQDNRNQHKTHPPQNKKHQDGKKRTEEETRPGEPEFERHL